MVVQILCRRSSGVYVTHCQNPKKADGSFGGGAPWRMLGWGDQETARWLYLHGTSVPDAWCLRSHATGVPKRVAWHVWDKPQPRSLWLYLPARNSSRSQYKHLQSKRNHINKFNSLIPTMNINLYQGVDTRVHQTWRTWKNMKKRRRKTMIK